jgi:hypothetical protein
MASEKRWIEQKRHLWICSECGAAEVATGDLTVCEAVCGTCGSDRESYLREVIPADSPNVLSEEEAGLVVRCLPYLLEGDEVAPARELSKRLGRFLDERAAAEGSRVD